MPLGISSPVSGRLAAIEQVLQRVVSENCRIIRWRVNEGEPEEIEIQISRTMKMDDIYRLFIDERGHHLIICMKSNDCYYLHARSNRSVYASFLNIH